MASYSSPPTTAMGAPRNPSTSPGRSSSGSSEEKLDAILCSDEFSVSKYLNLALSSDEQPQDRNRTTSMTNDDLSQRMTELALQLQLQTQTCHEDIGRIGAEMQAILPRCAADVGRVGLGLDGLRLDAATLLEAIAVDGETDVSSSLETLTTLHALQANLTRTKDILSAAATWDSTINSVNGLLASQNLTEAVHALALLESGERALRGMPHPEQRQEQIAGIRQQVSAMLAPQLKHALANMNTRIAPLQQCVALYNKLNKIESLKEEYVKNRPSMVHKAWFEYTPTNPSQEISTSNDNSVNKPADGFATWLPAWFDAVLSLLAEERRQSMAVFGAELVPEITIKVFQECFRPLLTSFKSRLEAVCSSNPSSPTEGSLDTICSIFESTLQFLSLVYEAISGSWLDLVEGNFLPADSGMDMYRSIVKNFLVVAAPFAPYQERLAQLESKYSGTLSRRIVKDIRDAASLKDSSLEALQLATERLRSLSGACFPVAASAISRFELMTGGYTATQCLSSIDETLADNAGELALAVHALSDMLLTDGFADSFDDSHVLCALEVLKIAGTFQRDLQSLELQTHERLQLLAERQSLNESREKEIETIHSSSGYGTSKSRGFDFPDAMSAVEIDSIIAKTICGQAVGEPSDLTSIVSSRLAISGDCVFARVEEARQRLATSCQSFVFGILVAVPRRQLKSMPSMLSWRETASTDDLSYGTLPQQYITHVGEHMLALVQALEPFASDREALSLANEAMFGIRDVALPQWRDLMGACNCNVDSDLLRRLMSGKEISELVLSGVSAEEEDIEEDEMDDSAKASAGFCNAWLDVVGLAVTGQLLECITRIPSLGAKGCDHLSADLDYLVNVFSALGVHGHPHPLLGHLGQLATIDCSALEDRISSFNRDDALALALMAIEERLSAIRAGGVV